MYIEKQLLKSTNYRKLPTENTNGVTYSYNIVIVVIKKTNNIVKPQDPSFGSQSKNLNIVQIKIKKKKHTHAK